MAKNDRLKTPHTLVDRVVVSLESSGDRRERFFSSESAKGFRIFNAFDGRKQGIPDFIDFDKFSQTMGRTPSGGEIGCVASHYLIIKDFAESGGDDSDLLLVAEDDALLSPNLNSVLEKILEKNIQIDCCVLADHFGGADSYDLLNPAFRDYHLSLFSKPLFINNPPFLYRVGTCSGKVRGTGLYLISRRACKAYAHYVSSIDKIHWVADLYEHWAPRMGLNLTYLRPNLADWAGESTIQNYTSEEDLPSFQEYCAQKREAIIKNPFRSVKFSKLWEVPLRKISGIYSATAKDFRV